MTEPAAKRHNEVLPNPGHKDAVWLGCTCPVTDNCNGDGYRGDPTRFLYNPECPIHKDNPEVFISECRKNVCEPGKHKWDYDGPGIETETMSSVVCSICGVAAIDEAMWED